MARYPILLTIPLLIFGCSGDKNPVGQAGGVINGKVTAAGVGLAGVTITVSGYAVSDGGSPKLGAYSVLASSAGDGDYSIEVLSGTYKIDFSIVLNSEWLHTARYPIIVSPGSEVAVNVDLKDPVPANLLAADGDAAVNVSWEPGYGADAHRVYRAETGQSDFEQVFELEGNYNSTLTYLDSPPDVGSYSYKITGVSEGIETEASLPAALVFTGSIGAPTGLRAMDRVTRVSLDWDRKERASYFKVFRSAVSPVDWVLLDSTGLNSYSDFPETFDNYQYRATAVSAYDTESAPSSPVTVNYDGRYEPPTGLTLIDRGSNFYLTWVDANYDGYFNIYRSLDPDLEFIRLDSTFQIGYEDVPLIHDHYYYRISVVGPNGLESDRSSAVGAFFDGRLDAPRQVQAYDQGLTVRVSWSQVQWTGAYILYRSDDEQTYRQIARVSGNDISYIDQPPEAGTYLYKVSSETIDGVEGPLSDPAGVYFSDNLTAPEDVRATNFGTYVNVYWTGVSDAGWYAVYRSPTAVGGYVEIGTSEHSGFIDVPQSAGNWFYKVKAHDDFGHESPFSFYGYVYYTNAPLPPSNVNADDLVHHVSIYWQSDSESYTFVVYRSTQAEGDYIVIDTVSLQIAEDWPSTAGHYYYKIRAFAEPDRYSNLSDDAHVYFSGLLAAPTNLRADTSGGYVSLFWNGVEGASEYDVYRGTSENQLDLIQTVYSPECTDAPSTGGTYYYAVTAKTQGGLESPRSAPVVVNYQP